LGAEVVPVKRSGRVFEAFTPWAGLVVGLIAAAFVHQFGSDSTFDHCEAMAPVPVIIVALGGLLATLGSGLVSWQSIRTSDGTRRTISIISVGMSALFAFAIILPVIAALLIPRCFQ
jgi:protein-S-isoprenylcysteine O-methyltransferase Ste14